MEHLMKNFLPILGKFVLTRGFLVVVGFFAAVWLPFYSSYYKSNMHFHTEGTRLVDMWSRWDAEWYLYISKYGYDPSHVGEAYEKFPAEYKPIMVVGWFPLYPMAIRYLNLLVHHRIIAGLIISNVFLLLFLWLLPKLGKEMSLKDEDVERTSWYYLIFPTSLFFSAVYTESLFMFLTLGAFYFAYKKNWWAACLLGGLSATCRIVGIVLIVPFALIYFKNAQYMMKNIKLSALYLLLIPAGLGAYMLYLYLKFGDPLAFMTVQEVYRHGATGFILNAFTRFFDMGPSFRGFYNNTNDFVIAVLAIIALPFIFKRFGFELGLYSAILVAIPMMSSLISMQRLILPSFPHFLLLGQLGKNIWADRVITVLSIGFLGLYFALYSQWGWVA